MIESNRCDSDARHLVPANEAGFSCYYAEWGFGGDGDMKAISNAGIAAVGLDDFAGVIQAFTANPELNKV